MKDIPRVFNLSGGRTSAMMTIEHYKPGDLVIFCDTEREAAGTYKFLDSIERVEGIPIIRLKAKGGWSKLLEKKKAVPNYFKRFCTIELKVKTARRYLRSLGLMEYENFIGFRYDEPHRVKDYKSAWQKVTPRFPLYEAKVKKLDVIRYFEQKDYDLEIPEILGNCDACFMKGAGAIISIYAQFPELAEKWIADEENNKEGHTYLPEMSHAQMLRASKQFGQQLDLGLVTPKFSCSCSSF
jgi:hypothetical protein